MLCDDLEGWERLKVGGEGDDRGWDGWMASLTQLTWVWVNSGSWWWTGRPGMLQSLGSQRVRHDSVTELNWTEEGWERVQEEGDICVCIYIYTHESLFRHCVQFTNYGRNSERCDYVKLYTMFHKILHSIASNNLKRNINGKKNIHAMNIYSKMQLS